MDVKYVIPIIIISFISVIIGGLIGFAMRKKIAEATIGSAEKEADNILINAKKEAEAKKKEILLEAKEESLKVKNEIENESRERKQEMQRFEKRLIQKEESLEKRSQTLERKEEIHQEKIAKLEEERQNIEQISNKKLEELERISGFTIEQAKEYLLSSLEEELIHEKAIRIKDMEANVKQEADRKAKEIIGFAIQRCAVDHVAESTVSVVPLPNDEMKGRIIGREGRNIRAIESLTGIDIIIDDTPEAVILSGFDPMKREIARIALEKLILDGRVHPAKIEEMVDKAKKEVETMIREEGESACFEIGVHGIHPELIRLLGKMKFRTSYGQNVLKHSLEVAYLTGIMAGELGLDVTLAKRAGLLHDIGKAVDYDEEGSHIELGSALCKKYKENSVVINAVESHHGDTEPTSLISVLVQAADAISAARPGARRETLETYIKRLQNLENIADSFEGVEKSFAIQAGRELRIMISPDIVDDDRLVLLARDISKKIEEELEYPGQIKVNLIRETRAIDYAR
ncbi:ribonuclease Y [[Clostridium] colinum]|uniref:ribonuclease Y n=1 Tax=[Clostridium] colinum TaxID=36835 RepID=UPI0038CDB758